MSKLNILQLYYEPHFSGITRHIGYIAKHVDREKYDIRVLCSTGDDRIESFLKSLLGDNRVKTVAPARIFSAAGAFAGFRLIKENQIDILHIHNIQSAVWGCLAGILAHVSHIVFTPHVVNLPSRIAERCFYLLWRILKPFEMVLALTTSQAELLTRWKIAGTNRLTTIPNCIEEPEILGRIKLDRDATRKKMDIDQTAVLVCQIGRLVFQKDPEALIRIAALTRQKSHEMVFLLVGEGHLAPRLKETIQRLGLEHVVRLTGFRSEALEILNASDIAVLTSRWEGLPYTLLEAICLKKPIVATDIAGNRDLVSHGETGFLTRTESDFCERLLELANSKPLREYMGNRGYERNRDLFAVDHMVREIEAVYDRVR